MTTLAAPKVALKLTPVPKTVLYAGLAGELLKNMQMKDDSQIAAVQQAVSEGLIGKVIVTGTHADGRIEKITLAFNPFQATDTVTLQMEPGKSYLETLDVGLAAAVQYVADLMKRRGLTPRYYVDWSARAKATPAIVAEAIKRLNLRVVPDAPPPPAPDPIPRAYPPPSPPSPPSPPDPPQRFPQTVHTYTAPPKLPEGYEFRPVLTITPDKDPGVTLTIESSRRR